MVENFISRGFRGRRREDPAVAGRVPPGQYITSDFPVLSAGPTPHTPLAQWDFAITGAVQPTRRWTWDEFRALPSESITVDIHCVTKWSKLDTVWEGASIRSSTALDGWGVCNRVLRRRLHHEPSWRIRQGLVAFEYSGEPLVPSMAVRQVTGATPLLWKSAAGARSRDHARDRSGFWSRRLPRLWGPMAG
jgi:hypothetical protein